METFDGNYTLAETESAIQEQEAAGRKLTDLKKGSASPPTNEADFKNVDDVPDDFHLTLGKIPSGKKEAWSGSIYVEGKSKSAKGYRG